MCHSVKRTNIKQEYRIKMGEVLIQWTGVFVDLLRIKQTLSELIFWVYFVVCASASLPNVLGKIVLIPPGSMNQVVQIVTKLLCNAALANTPGLQCGYL